MISGSKVSPIFTGLPPSHQAALLPSKTSLDPDSVGISLCCVSITELTSVFFYRRFPLLLYLQIPRSDLPALPQLPLKRL